ncbi:hypothetical protein DCCM_4337 [Desulfocucumis palustris]|uniref:Uncharacterized protein n=1 Tax=Desulfocucumis palustris TaxID=1898651 RepID=A0A2L2XGU1_9FIRM|nr:hypothetical protein DCCM_4337 [Desulfocucumis palustris]
MNIHSFIILHEKSKQRQLFFGITRNSFRLLRRRRPAGKAAGHQIIRLFIINEIYFPRNSVILARLYPKHRWIFPRGLWLK